MANLLTSMTTGVSDDAQAEQISNKSQYFGMSRQQLVTAMRGSKIVIPDFQQLLKHWPMDVHPDVERLNRIVDERLESIFSFPEDERRLRWLKACKLGLFAASWWPYARFESLQVAANLAIWLFAWDDETDSQEFSSLVENFEKASAFRGETLRYLDASSSIPTKVDLAGITTHRLITNFKPVGEAAARTYDDRQMTTFLRELRFFIEMNEEEHGLQMTPTFPTIEDYNRRRMGSSATRVCLALHELTLGVRLPHDIMESNAMETIWHEANMIISTMNDVLSIKKEMDQSQVDTLVPLLTLQLGSVQTAVDVATDMIKSSIERFEAAEKELIEAQSTRAETQEQVYSFINSCKYACTANMNWSLSSGRYKLNAESMHRGIRITL